MAYNVIGLGDRLRNEACAKPVLVAGGIFSTKLQSKHVRPLATNLSLTTPLVRLALFLLHIKFLFIFAL
jgi:hypothetical protein